MVTVFSPAIVVVGVVMMGLGLIGVRWADRVVDAQREHGFRPLTDDSVTRTDRLAATRFAGSVMLVLGVLVVIVGLVGW